MTRAVAAVTHPPQLSSSPSVPRPERRYAHTSSCGSASFASSANSLTCALLHGLLLKPAGTGSSSPAASRCSPADQDTSLGCDLTAN